MCVGCFGMWDTPSAERAICIGGGHPHFLVGVSRAAFWGGRGASGRRRRSPGRQGRGRQPPGVDFSTPDVDDELIDDELSKSLRGGLRSPIRSKLRVGRLARYLSL